MKKSISLFAIIFMITQLFAFNARKATIDNLYKQVQQELGHNIQKYEQNIIDSTYLYYYKKCNGAWTKELWETTVNKSVELCNNKKAVAASKAGDFGEKFLQSLIVTTEDAFSGFNNWLNKNSEEYKKRH